MGESFADMATGGPLALALLFAAVAGLVSFLSPCVLPLVPGYLSYVTGLVGADLSAALGEREGPRRRGRVLAGTALFTAGFGVVFITTTVLAARLGGTLISNARTLEIVAGVLIILFGVAMLGWIPGLQREVRIHRLPQAGLWGAPVFGAVFALSWIPCIGPTLGAVMLLGTSSGQPVRAAALATAYCLGIGAPFLALGLGMRRLAGVVKAIRRNSHWVTRIGGALLVLVGIALVTGAWGDFIIWLRATVGPGSVSL
ncbi:cytochrome c biogenesis protein CcdA [Hamadaea sp. NPDC050747]|uniref:cytochrome c biogenesis CcdA family protein n=1 Tax=Hamadaea sp. NPDC050747 TaxID=3155789 RepID=UPI0033F5CF78